LGQHGESLELVAQITDGCSISSHLVWLRQPRK